MEEKMKVIFSRLLFVTGIFLVAISICSCRKKQPLDLLEQIKRRGEITIAMEGVWSPWTYHDENDEN